MPRNYRISFGGQRTSGQISLSPDPINFIQDVLDKGGYLFTDETLKGKGTKADPLGLSTTLDFLRFRGSYDASSGAPYGGAQAGDFYLVTAGGNGGGYWSNISPTGDLETGDAIFAKVDNPTSEADWVRLSLDFDFGEILARLKIIDKAIDDLEVAVGENAAEIVNLWACCKANTDNIDKLIIAVGDLQVELKKHEDDNAILFDKAFTAIQDLELALKKAQDDLQTQINNNYDEFITFLKVDYENHLVQQDKTNADFDIRIAENVDCCKKITSAFDFFESVTFPDSQGTQDSKIDDVAKTHNKFVDLVWTPFYTVEWADHVGSQTKINNDFDARISDNLVCCKDRAVELDDFITVEYTPNRDLQDKNIANNLSSIQANELRFKTLESSGGHTKVNFSGVPAYADDAAAGVGGLVAGDLFQTSGAGAAPLNVAGIVMIKQ